MDDYPSVFKMAMKADERSRNEASLQWMIDHSKNLEIKADAKKNTATLIYHMRNVKRNSLYSFLQFAKQVDTTKANKEDKAAEDDSTYEDDGVYEEDPATDEDIIIEKDEE